MTEETTTERPSAAARPADESGAAALGRGGRMSRSRKMVAVLRLLRGEDLEMVSRGLGVTAATLSQWREAFLAAGEAALASRPESGEALVSERLKARLGQALIARDLLEEKIARLETKRLWTAGGRSRQVSPVRGKPYGLAMVWRVWLRARATAG